MSTRTFIRVDKEAHCLSSDKFHGMFPSNELNLEIHTSVNSPLPLSRIFTLQPTQREDFDLSIGLAHYPPKMVAIVPVMEVKLFESVFNTSLLIADNVLEFGDHTAISSFPAFIHCTSRTSANWGSLTLNVSGWFLGLSNDSLPAQLEEIVQDEVRVLASESLARKQQAEATHLQTAARVDQIEMEVAIAEQLVEHARQLYNATLEEINDLTDEIFRLEQEVAGANTRVRNSQLAVSDLCEMEECGVVCQPTIESQITYEDIFVPINTTCRIRENVTQEVRVPPFFKQKVSWRFIEECLTYTSPCPSGTEICKYNRCANLCKSFIEFIPVDNYMNVTTEQFRDVMCIQNIYNETVTRVEYFTNPCGKMVQDPNCLNRSAECQREHDRAYAKIEEVEQGLTAPLQLLSKARTNLTVAENNLIRYELILSASESQLQLLSLVYDSVSFLDEASQENYDLVVDGLETGLRLGELLKNTSVGKIFSIVNVTFSTTVFPNAIDLQLLPITILVRSAFDGDERNELPVDYLYDLTQSFEAQKTNIGDFVFERVFASSSRRRRHTSSQDRHKRESLEAELNHQVQCAELNIVANLLLYLQYTLSHKQQQAMDLLYDILELVEVLEAGHNETIRSRSAPANYTLLTSNFGITKEELNSEELPSADTSAVQAVLEVMDEIRSQAERVAASVEVLEFTQWQSNIESLQAETESVGQHQCFGLADCLLVLSDTVRILLENAPLSSARELLGKLPSAQEDLFQLAVNSSLTPSLALAHLQPFLLIVLEMKDIHYWCASPPEITVHPENVVNVTRGGVLTLQCAAISTLPFTYVWRKDGVALQDSNAPVLTVSNMQVDKEGNYTCEATNAIGTSTATRSIVHTYFLPEFYRTPVSTMTYLGDENGAWFGCNSTSRPAPGWIWQHRKTPKDEWKLFPGVETNELLIRQPSRLNEGQYRCITYNWHGNITSEPVDLKLLRASLRVTAIPVHLQLNDVSNHNAIPKQRRSTEDIEEMVFNLLFDVLGLDESTVQKVAVMLLDEGGALSVSFLITSQNITSVNTSTALLEELLPALLRAEDELYQLKEDLQTYLMDEVFSYTTGTTYLNTTSVTFSATTILCPPGQQLHENRIHCGKC